MDMPYLPEMSWETLYSSRSSWFKNLLILFSEVADCKKNDHLALLEYLCTILQQMWPNLMVN